MQISSITTALRRKLVAAALNPDSGRGAGAEPVCFPDRGITVYVHLPFCGSTCTYCSFNRVRPGADAEALMEAYVAAVEREIDCYARRPRADGARVSSIFFGGGTPSFLPPRLIQRLLRALRGAFPLEDGCQITLEANPEWVSADNLARYRTFGVNRVSLGVQSFDERLLALLGRRHRRAQIDGALELLRGAGFEDISIDLMYGLPGQTLADLGGDLRAALSAPVGHLSLFPMIYRPDTPLYRRRVQGRPLRQMYYLALRRLRRAGFVQYTTEDFTRSGVHCAYQLDTWQPPARSCLALGAGALSHVDGSVWTNIGDLAAYIQRTAEGAAPVAHRQRLTRRQQMIEHLLRSTRCLRLDRGLFERRHGRSVESLVGPLPRLACWAGLAREAGEGVLELTPRGAYHASLWWSDFILQRLAEAGGAG